MGGPYPSQTHTLLPVFDSRASLSAVPREITQSDELLLSGQSLEPLDAPRHGPQALRQLIQNDLTLVHVATLPWLARGIQRRSVLVGSQLFRATHEGSSTAVWETFQHHCDGLLGRCIWPHGLTAEGSRYPVTTAFGGLDIGNVPCPSGARASAEVQLSHTCPREQLAQARLSVSRIEQLCTYAPISTDGLPSSLDDGLSG
jgi:hypothetical protein